MSLRSFRFAAKYISRGARRFLKGERGVAAIEFAFIAPIMIAMLAGTVELSQGLTADRRVSQIASATADLVAREKVLTSTEVDGILQIVSSLVQPYDPINLKISLLSVVSTAASATDTSVCWIYSYNGGVEAAGVKKGSQYTVPTGILDKASSVIIANVTYDYRSPLFQDYIAGTLALQQKFYLKPRQSNEVTMDGVRCLS